MTIDFVYLTNLIEHYGYWAVFLAMILEGMCVPIPSELLLAFAGFMVYQGIFSFPAAVASAWLGSMLGSSFIYFVARRGGRELLCKFFCILRISPTYVDKVGEWFIRYGPAIIIPWRMLPVMRTKSSIAAGLLHMRPVTFIILTALGIAAWCSLAIGFGLFFGPHWQNLITILTDLVYVVIALVCACVLIGLYCCKKAKRKKEATNNEHPPLS